GIGTSSDGSFVVDWREDGSGAVKKVNARLFNKNAVAVGGDFTASINTATDQFAPAAAMDTAGNFLLLWYQRQRSPSIFARYFSVGALPSPMTVDGASPNSGDRGATNLSVDISGTGFTVGSGSGFSADFIISGTSTVDFSASAVNCTTTVLC